jgi:hypothetical protein
VITAVIIFAAGPAAAIRPVSKVLVSPLNMTAPGAAKTNPVRTAKINDKRRPFGYILNSDQSPYLCAINLCESSCTKKAVKIPKKDMGIAAGKFCRLLNPYGRLLFEKTKANASVSTPIAIRICIISILLNDPGFPTSKVPFGTYMYSLGERS